MSNLLSHVIAAKARAHKVGKAAHVSEPWVHAIYCMVLFAEGHGLYATIGGVLGVVVVVSNLFGGEA